MFGRTTQPRNRLPPARRSRLSDVCCCEGSTDSIHRPSKYPNRLYVMDPPLAANPPAVGTCNDFRLTSLRRRPNTTAEFVAASKGPCDVPPDETSCFWDYFQRSKISDRHSGCRLTRLVSSRLRSRSLLRVVADQRAVANTSRSAGAVVGDNCGYHTLGSEQFLLICNTSILWGSGRARQRLLPL